MKKSRNTNAVSETPAPPEGDSVAAQLTALLDQIEALVPNYTKPTACALTRSTPMLVLRTS